ncbi:MAG: hypothetical protein WCH99_02095 [Verrucomicrobiota bacterium]
MRDNGTLTEYIIRERDLKAEGDVLDELTADVTRQQRNVMAERTVSHNCRLNRRGWIKRQLEIILFLLKPKAWRASSPPPKSRPCTQIRQ